MSKESHMERTAAEPRRPAMHTIVIKRIEEINDRIRVFRLEIPPGKPSVHFLPGQFLDVYCPGVAKAGGFTPTSPPSRARQPSAIATATATDSASGTTSSAASASAGPSTSTSTSTSPGYIELAVQCSPENPAAVYLWRGSPSVIAVADDDEEEKEEGEEPLAVASLKSGNDDDQESSSNSILGAELQIRVGGSFVYPPPGILVSLPTQLRRIVFVAGGMGVNPLVSMASHLAEQTREAQRLEVRFLYSLRRRRRDDDRWRRRRRHDDDGDYDDSGRKEKRVKRVEGARRMLFLERIVALFSKGRLKGELKLFLTDGAQDGAPDGGGGGGGEKEQEEEEKKKWETGKDGDREEEEEDDDDDEADGVVSCNEVGVPFRRRRIGKVDLVEALGPDRRTAVVYICGVPDMTDRFVKELTSPAPEGIGMECHRVLYEKWW